MQQWSFDGSLIYLIWYPICEKLTQGNVCCLFSTKSLSSRNMASAATFKIYSSFYNFQQWKKNKQWPPLIEDVLFENLYTFIRCSNIKQNASKVSKSYSDNIETYHYVRFKKKTKYTKKGYTTKLILIKTHACREVQLIYVW